MIMINESYFLYIGLKDFLFKMGFCMLRIVGFYFCVIATSQEKHHEAISMGSSYHKMALEGKKNKCTSGF